MCGLLDSRKGYCIEHGSLWDQKRILTNLNPNPSTANKSYHRSGTVRVSDVMTNDADNADDVDKANKSNNNSDHSMLQLVGRKDAGR